MDLKEQIIKFLNEETEQYRCTESGDCRAISNDNKEDTEYLANELTKLFSLHIVSQRELVNKEVSKSIKSFCEYVMYPESDLHKDADDWIKEHHT